MENSSLEEKRKLAYGRGKDGKNRYSSKEDQAVEKKIPVVKKEDEQIEEEKCSQKAGRCQKAGNLGNELSAWTFWEEQAGNLDGQGSERGTRKTDALMNRQIDNQEEKTRTSQVEDIVHTEEKLLPTEEYLLKTDVTNTTDKVIQKEDSYTFDVNFKFGSPLYILPTGEEMQEEEEDDRKDVTPGK